MGHLSGPDHPSGALAELVEHQLVLAASVERVRHCGVADRALMAG